MNVVKIGGGGSEDAFRILNNAENFANDADLVGVALSGPGGTLGRATERMIQMTELHQNEGDYQAVMDESEAQFMRIAKGVGNIGLAKDTMKEIKDAFEHGYGYPWIRMRPEFFIARTYQYVLEQAGVQVKLVNPVNSIFMSTNGRLDIPKTYKGLQSQMEPGSLHLLPGFAARRSDLTMDNVGRGSTDLVGAAFAGALQDRYPDSSVRYILKKDDVNGVMCVSPKIIPTAEVANELSTGEVETLALGGSEVVHPAVLQLIEDTWSGGVQGVTLHVKNTFDDQHPGTNIVPLNKREIDPNRPVVGIASQPVDAYKWKDPTTDDSPGSLRDVSMMFAKHGVSINDVQTARGGVITAYVSSAEASQHALLKADLEAANGGTAEVEVQHNLELVVVVGDALRQSRPCLETMSVISTVANELNVELGGLNHIGGEPSISITVPADRAKVFIRALYARMFTDK